MQLIDDWKRKATRLWSIRLGIVAAIFTGAEGILPLFSDSIPRGAFASLSFLTTVGAMVARLVAQPELHGDSK